MLQGDSATDDVGAGGGSAAFGPSNETECEQQVRQSSVASSTEAPPPKAEEKKELPKTGGDGSTSLMALGAGALLVGGLLVRRIIVR